MTLLETPPATETARDRVIREAQTAVVKRILADPDRARSTIRTTGHVGEGLTCEVVQGQFSATLDLGKGMGGDAAGPSPGFFARAAIAGCVGIAVKMLAAREGVRFHGVDVAVETDFDDAALFGIGGGNAAPVRTRVSIDIDTDAPRDLVQSLVDRALAMDPWFLALRNAQDVSAAVVVARKPAPLRADREQGDSCAGQAVSQGLVWEVVHGAPNAAQRVTSITPATQLD